VPPINAGDTAWVLAASALVMLMTPGLALFYGGMTRAKSVLNMLMMCFSTIAVVSVLWVLYGYSLTFTTGGFIENVVGNFSAAGLVDEISQATADEGGIPVLLFAAFQLMFAIITAALITGAIADRAKFAGWLVFVVLWVTVVYFPVAHWVFNFGDSDVAGDGGWIADRLLALDFAGGTAVHINAGAAALALALVLGKRVGWPKDRFRPHNLPLVLLGAGLLWFGWFGFNAGSAVAANGMAGLTFLNTQVATGAAVLGWIVVEWIRDGKPTTLGAASGAIAGLVAITPACSTVDPLGAAAVGVIAGVLCALAVGLKYRFGYDDSLDVVGVHLVGGVVGSLLIGLFANGAVSGALGADVEPGVDGLFYGGGLEQLGRQAVAVVAVLAYSFVVSFILGWIVDKTVGFRVAREAEVDGIDAAEHAESAYDFSGLGGGLGSGAGAGAERPSVSSRPATESAATGEPAKVGAGGEQA